MKIKRGDKVLVLWGKDRNKTGIVDKVSRKSDEIVVSGVNQVKKHAKVSKSNPSGGVVEISKPMPAGKVALVCPACDKATRIGYETKGKEKVRVCKKCGKEVIRKEKKGKE